ncbi:fad binding domain-containing protein [Moniliophthora roreri]|nr:fad binding domain-containing protein [Moniliophthora roreri]
MVVGLEQFDSFRVDIEVKLGVGLERHGSASWNSSVMSIRFLIPITSTSGFVSTKSDQRGGYATGSRR